jgi:hypothetical protein
MTLSGPAPQSTTLGGTITDATGNYSFQNLPNGSYTITPSLNGYTFNPTSLVVAISYKNADAINFISIKQ